MEFGEVTCPSCFEMFEVCLPGYGELPAEVDYDCEVCCRPLIISFWEDEDGEVWAEGRSLED